mgnify:CR=1 FL=1
MKFSPVYIYRVKLEMDGVSMKKDEVLEDKETLEDLAEETSEKDSKVEEEAVENEASTEDKETAEDEAIDLSKKIVETENKFLRLQAEFQNFKERTEKEKTDIYKFANERLFVELLGIMDNMERAMDHVEESSVENMLEGLKMIKKSFDDVFEKNSVEGIKSVGEPFDPELHHEVMSEENEEYDADVVIQELQKGYKINSKVIRPAMVKVSK